MNCIHKIVWSKVKNSYVVVSELVKSHTKNTGTVDENCFSDSCRNASYDEWIYR